jgi:hypothetical protein
LCEKSEPVLIPTIWTLLRRHPIALVSIGFIIGIPIGWFLGAKTAVKTVILPAKTTAYRNLSNEELKNKVLQLASAIRGLARSFYEDDNRMRISADEKSASAKSQSERDQIRKTWIEDSGKLHNTYLARYEDKFWADAVLLREAVVARVGGVPGARNPIIFEHPTNMLGIEEVANSLELLGKSLPDV